MHPDEPKPTAPAADEIALRQALSALAVERRPGADLWPAIAARLEPHQAATAAPAGALSPTRGASRRPPRRRALLQSLAACAALLAVLVLALPWHQSKTSLQAQSDPYDRLLIGEALALDREYAAAFAQFEGAALPAPLQPGLIALEQESARVRALLVNQPQQTRLLHELRELHERRLRLLKRGLELFA
jgi:hypothetical protein